jgi:tetratricopeptide (TPR) repeat protein
MRSLVRLALVAALATLPLTGWAMGSSDPSPPKVTAVDPDFSSGKMAIDTKDWATAISALSRVVAKNAKDADAFNYLGFAYRNQGNYAEAFKHYASALQINPKHRGAHEYVGEAYLKTGNIAKAEEHLKALDDICTFGCAEYTELKKKVAVAKAGKSS